MAIYPDPKVCREMSERGAGSRVHAFKRAKTPYTGYQKQGADILPQTLCFSMLLNLQVYCKLPPMQEGFVIKLLQQC
jgi:hypothetical protein